MIRIAVSTAAHGTTRGWYSSMSAGHVFEIERIGLNIKGQYPKRRCITEIKTAVNVHTGANARHQRTEEVHG